VVDEVAGEDADAVAAHLAERAVGVAVVHEPTLAVAHRAEDTVAPDAGATVAEGAHTIGAELAAKAAGDGYTLWTGQTSNLAINPTLLAKIAYDPVRDFTPISLYTTSQLVLVVNAGSPVKSVKDLIAAAKASPGRFTFGSPGTGKTLLARAIAVARTIASDSLAAYATIKAHLLAPALTRITESRARIDREFLDVWFSDAARRQMNDVRQRLLARH
jgi:hypothetical protein